MLCFKNSHNNKLSKVKYQWKRVIKLLIKLFNRLKSKEKIAIIIKSNINNQMDISIRYHKMRINCHQFVSDFFYELYLSKILC